MLRYDVMIECAPDHFMENRLFCLYLTHISTESLWPFSIIWNWLAYIHPCSLINCMSCCYWYISEFLPFLEHLVEPVLWYMLWPLLLSAYNPREPHDIMHQLLYYTRKLECCIPWVSGCNLHQLEYINSLSLFHRLMSHYALWGMANAYDILVYLYLQPLFGSMSLDRVIRCVTVYVKTIPWRMGYWLSELLIG